MVQSWNLDSTSYHFYKSWHAVASHKPKLAKILADCARIAKNLTIFTKEIL